MKAKIPFVLSARERRQIEARFFRDLDHLGRLLDAGPQGEESKANLIERLVSEFRHLALVKHRRLFDPGPGPARIGRPPARPVLEAKAKSGAPKRFTPSVERWFLNEIDRWVKKLEERDLPSSDSEALRRSMRLHYKKRFLAKGHTEEEALRLAEEQAAKLFPTRRAHLSRLRTRQLRGDFSS